MSRPIWKSPFLDYKLLVFFYKNKKSNINLFYNTILFPIFINKTLCLYNGYKFINIKIYEKMIGSHIKDYLILKNKIYGKNKKCN